jgi:hypothetical protein
MTAVAMTEHSSPPTLSVPSRTFGTWKFWSTSKLIPSSVPKHESTSATTNGLSATFEVAD